MNLNLVKMARDAGFHVGDQFAAGCSEDDLRKLAAIIAAEIEAINPPQRTWVGLMRGVRVEGDTVVISTKNNDAARELCSELINEINK